MREFESFKDLCNTATPTHSQDYKDRQVPFIQPVTRAFDFAEGSKYLGHAGHELQRHEAKRRIPSAASKARCNTYLV
ncbi:hypothetical protein B0G84_7764 [Paraburkholderia sp. BL8N3]|nr:hypothetical protein B0G84_7764 [Paraburkholderia sp. BL8N3]